MILSNTNNFYYKDLEITHILKNNLKNSYITISKDAQIILKTPKVSSGFIEKLLSKKEKWIREKVIQIKMNPSIEVKLEDEVLLFGKIHSINSIETKKLKLALEKIKISSPSKIQKQYDFFYKDFSSKYIRLRVEYFSKLMELSYNEIKYRKMKSRWGSCSSMKILTFNTELIKIKKELIDYVVVHELAHLKHMNHSSLFHAFVLKYLPNSKYLISELKNIKLR